MRSPLASMKMADSAVDTPGTRWQRAAVDILARQRRQHAVAIGILARRTAHRADERRLTAEPRDRHRGVGGAAAVDDEERVGLRLAVRLREISDAKHLVEHDDARAQDARARAVVPGQRRTSLPFST